MRKLICIVLVLIQIGCFGLACAKSTDMSAVLHQLLVDWSEYLGDYEVMYSRCYDALGYMKVYSESRNWEDLIRARTCAIYVKSVLEYYATSPIETGMTNENYQLLTSAGYDLGDVQSTINIYNTDTIETLQEEDVPIWSHYILKLMESYYTVDDILYFKKTAGIQQDFIILLAKYIYLENNMVLLELPEETKDPFIQWCNENLPFIMSCYDQLFTSENEVKNEMVSVMDEMEDVLLLDEERINSGEWSLLETYDQFLEVKETIGALQGEVNEGKKTTEEANRELLEICRDLYAEITNLNNLPLIISYPEVGELNEDELYYYWVDQEGNTTGASYPFQMEQIPNCFYMEIPNASMDDYYKYAIYLEELGFEVTAMSDTAIALNPDDSTTMLVSMKDSTLQIYVKGNQICFINAPYMLTKVWMQEKEAQ